MRERGGVDGGSGLKELWKGMDGKGGEGENS